MDLTNLEPDVTSAPPRLVVYGPQGSGKTTFAAQAPSTIFMDIEDGLHGIKSAKQRVKNWGEVLEMITALHQQEHKFKTLAVDTIDWLERLIHTDVALNNNVNAIDDIPYGRGFNYAVSQWETFLKGMTSLRDNKGMTIILLAHDKIKRFDDPMTDGYDRYMLKLHDKAGALVQEWADGVLFMKGKTFIKTEKAGFSEKKKGVDGGVYLHTTETPAYQAKHRTALALPDEFPVSEKNSWGDFIAAIGSRK